MHPTTPERPRLPLSLVIVGLVVAGLVALAVLQWVVGVVFGLVRLALLVVAVGAVATAVVRLALGRR